MSHDEHSPVIETEEMSLEDLIKTREALLRPLAEKIIDSQQPLRDRYASIVKEIRLVAGEYGMTFEQYLSMPRSQAIDHVLRELKRREAAVSTPRTPGQILPKKFRHPKHPELEWTGRGMQPRWVKDYLSENKKHKIDDLRIQPEPRRA
jgi:DNA-binding protein H-NS